MLNILQRLATTRKPKENDIAPSAVGAFFSPMQRYFLRWCADTQADAHAAPDTSLGKNTKLGLPGALREAEWHGSNSSRKKFHTVNWRNKKVFPSHVASEEDWENSDSPHREI